MSGVIILRSQGFASHATPQRSHVALLPDLFERARIVAASKLPSRAASSDLPAEPSLQITPVQFEMRMRLVSYVLPIPSIPAVALTFNDEHLWGFREYGQPSA